MMVMMRQAIAIALVVRRCVAIVELAEREMKRLVPIVVDLLQRRSYTVSWFRNA